LRQSLSLNLARQLSQERGVQRMVRLPRQHVAIGHAPAAASRQQRQVALQGVMV
jgi:hypothetical protein